MEFLIHARIHDLFIIHITIRILIYQYWSWCNLQECKRQGTLSIAHDFSQWNDVKRMETFRDCLLCSPLWSIKASAKVSFNTNQEERWCITNRYGWCVLASDVRILLEWKFSLIFPSERRKMLPSIVTCHLCHCHPTPLHLMSNLELKSASVEFWVLSSLFLFPGVAQPSSWFYWIWIWFNWICLRWPQKWTTMSNTAGENKLE